MKFCKNLIRKLLYYAEINRENGAANSRLILFNNFYGFSAAVNDYKNVFIIAGKFEITIYLPYLKRFIYGYNICKVYIRRIYLI